MIKAQASAPKGDFEVLLENAKTAIETALDVGRSLSSAEFEEAVFKALNRAARKTPFENSIERTSERAFPDIQVQKVYGVEVKQSSSEKAIAMGNSIFESSRLGGIEDIYIVIAYNTKKQPIVEWKSYEESITGIAITHSPRYIIDLSANESFFNQIGKPYDEFRKLSQDEMMKYVRGYYEGKGKSNLWWLNKQDRPMSYRYFTDLDKNQRARFIGECFFLCPEVFGRGMAKFQEVGVYALAQGIINHNWRDTFTSGGKVKIGDYKYPQIIAKAVEHLPYIRLAAENITNDVLVQFWGERIPDRDDRIERWGKKIIENYKGEGDISVLGDI